MHNRPTLGQRYRSDLGVEGICIGIADYLDGTTDGCIEYADGTGKVQRLWTDVNRLVPSED